jgi:MinD superfamily P-loop ATPase
MIRVDENKCDFCGTCVAVCPVDAIEILEFEVIIDERMCTHCSNCICVCPWGALEEEK